MSLISIKPLPVPPEPTYQELRASAYPSIPSQLDMQYHDAVNTTATWVEAIEAVKVAYPKPVVVVEEPVVEPSEEPVVAEEEPIVEPEATPAEEPAVVEEEPVVEPEPTP